MSPTPTPIPRPRLLEPLAHWRAYRCITVTGPAGSGKTSLLRTWAARLARQARVVWFEGADEPAPQFAARLLALCARDGGLPLGAAPPAVDPLPTLAVTLLRAAAEQPVPLVLVLDGVHCDTALRALQPVLDYCPGQWLCVFAARRPLPLSLGRLRTYGQLHEVLPHELDWTPEETEMLLRRRLGVRVAAAQAPAWHRATGGWSLGLATLCQSARTAGADVALATLLQPALAFLRRELLGGLPADVLRWLALLSAMQPFDAALAAQMAPFGRAESAAWLDRFAHTQGFVLPAADGGEGAWRRFHPVLGLLLQQGFARLPAAARRDAHRTASAFYRERGLGLQAVRHAIAAGDAAAAAHLVEAAAPALFQAGDLQQLAGLLHALPQRVANARPGLRIWLAALCLLEHRFAPCRALLDRLARDTGPADTVALRPIGVLRGWLAIHEDDMEAAAAALAGWQPQDSAAGDLAAAAGRNVLSWVQIYRSRYQQARDIQQCGPAPEQAPPGGLFGTLTGQGLVGFSLALEGRMNDAERSYRDVLHAAEGQGQASGDAACLASGLLVEVLYELNDLDGVHAQEHRVADWERLALPDPLLRVMLCIARAHAVAGRHDRAFAALARLEAYGRTHRLDRLLAYALLEQVRLHLQREDPASARQAHAEIVRLRLAHAQAASTALGEVAMVADRVEILLHLHHGRFDSARGCIDALLQACTASGRGRRIAALHLQRAVADRAAGAAESALAQTALGLRHGARLGLLRSLLDAHALVPTLLDELMAQRPPEPLLAFHADRLRAAVGRGPLAQADLGGMGRGRRRPGGTERPAAELSERERQAAQCLAMAMPNKQIAREMGISPETVKWHLRNLFAKLGVTQRYEAVALLRATGRGA